MSSKPLSFKEICAIIKVSGDNGVASLKLGGLDVVFQARAQSNVASENEFIPTTKITEAVSEAVETNEETEEYRRAQELITDPEAHELAEIERATQE